MKAWLSKHWSIVVLLGAGITLLALGLTAATSEALAIALAVCGVGCLVLGALLPRLEGPVKVGPGGAEVNVIRKSDYDDAIAQAASTFASLDPEEFQARVDDALGGLGYPRIHVGPEEPEAPNGGDIWIDPSDR